MELAWLDALPSQRDIVEQPRDRDDDDRIEVLDHDSPASSKQLTPEYTPPGMLTPRSPSIPPAPTDTRRGKQVDYNDLPDTGEAPLDAIAPKKKRRGDEVDESNIISEPRMRKKTEGGKAHEASLKGKGKREASNIVAAFAQHAIRELEDDVDDEYKAYGTFYTAFASGMERGIHRDNIVNPPEHWNDLKHHPHAEGFKKAAELEYNTLKARNTFMKVPKEEGMNPIPVRWVFDYKFDASGYLARYKGRIVVRGDKEPLTGEETYAATLAFRVFRWMMALAAAYNLSTRQLDAVNSFINAKLHKKIYCYMPQGFERPGYVWWLLMALYGLRKSPLLWLQELSGTLKDYGL